METAPPKRVGWAYTLPEMRLPPASLKKMYILKLGVIASCSSPVESSTDAVNLAVDDDDDEHGD